MDQPPSFKLMESFFTGFWEHMEGKMPHYQNKRFNFDPLDGVERKVYPHDEGGDAWRAHHGAIAWLYNPWTGARRTAVEVGDDVFGVRIYPPGVPGGTDIYGKTIPFMYDTEEVDSGPYRDDAHPENFLPVRYFSEPPSKKFVLSTTYAVYGTSSISYVERLREEVAALRAQVEQGQA